MSIKLTLSISDKDLIEAAKQYAEERNVSLSRIIEEYLKILIGKENQKPDPESFTPRVKSLIGAFKTDRKVDFKKERLERLEKKYLNG